ncbi:hypothetical protein [Streptomyces fuscichromogenes]|uniref:Uncharacterized protein n=1 Tax=Streptomyces fuscichromogenes TaxID=1324013 RepID=A0A918CU71_9ACTN|nr:hypothetical protein [Streptomyces fuscichromogenes]GGN27382.1 hypothetical protein GCM10011578_062660 [Streptomyces fuscichromogenes]
MNTAIADGFGTSPAPHRRPDGAPYLTQRDDGHPVRRHVHPPAVAAPATGA